MDHIFKRNLYGISIFLTKLYTEVNLHLTDCTHHKCIDYWTFTKWIHLCNSSQTKMEKVFSALEASLMLFPSPYTLEITTLLTFITVSYCKWSRIVHTLFCGCFHSTFCSCDSSTLQHVFSLHYNILLYLLLFNAKSCPTLCDLMNFSAPGFPVLHHFPEFAQTHVHWVSDAIQSSHLLLLPSPPILNLSQRQGLFQWVISSYQVAKVLEFQLRHQSFQRIFRVDFL